MTNKILRSYISFRKEHVHHLKHVLQMSFANKFNRSGGSVVKRSSREREVVGLIPNRVILNTL